MPVLGSKGLSFEVIFDDFSLVFHQNRNSFSLLFVLQGDLSKMSLTWREREHEEEDMISLHDLVTVNALRNCGLLKFFCISSMRAHISLLQYMLDSWDPINQVF